MGVLWGELVSESDPVLTYIRIGWIVTISSLLLPLSKSNFQWLSKFVGYFRKSLHIVNPNPPTRSYAQVVKASLVNMVNPMAEGGEEGTASAQEEPDAHNGKDQCLVECLRLCGRR
jgi:hypothetical protein